MVNFFEGGQIDGWSVESWMHPAGSQDMKMGAGSKSKQDGNGMDPSIHFFWEVSPLSPR